MDGWTAAVAMGVSLMALMVLWCVLRSVGERVGVGCIDCVVPTPAALTVAPNLEVPLRTHRRRGSQGALLCQPARNRNRRCYCRPLA